MTCVIIDDEKSGASVLEEYVAKVPHLLLKGQFHDPIPAIQFLNENAIDLVFLDINMPDINGLQLVSTLNQPIPMIIYTTAYTEYAIASYEQNAIDYLLKPISFQRFLTAVSKAVKLLNLKHEAVRPKADSGNRQHSLFIKSGNQLHQVSMEDVLFLEKDGHYVTFHSKDRKIISRLSMNQIQNLLPDQKFVQIHKSYVVALDHIDIIEAAQVSIGVNHLPIGHTYKKAFFERVNRHKAIGN